MDPRRRSPPYAPSSPDGPASEATAAAVSALENPEPRLLPCPDRSGYTDPVVLGRELARFFARRWMLVGRASEIPEPGDFVTAEVAGENVIVVRHGDGGARAMLNVCRHRGARILLDEQGSCPRVLRCPYHSWSYDLDGTLIGAPNMRDAVRPAQARLGLQRVAVVERYGCLWVNLDPGASDFDAEIGAQLRARIGSGDALSHWELDRLVTGRRIHYNVAANWKLIVENFMECYHCSSIHPELVAIVPEFRGGVASQALEIGYGSMLSQEANGFTVDGRIGLPTLTKLTQVQQRAYYAITLFPNAFLNLFDDHVVLHRLIPHAVDRTEVVCDWLFAPESLAASPDIDPTVELFDRVNRQDFEACERCQLGAGSQIYAHDNLLVPAEHHLARLHDELRAALGAE